MTKPEEKPLRIFLAMPGTDLGPEARWKRPEDVRQLFENFRQVLERRLGRPVSLGTEREKREAGVIHDSMFREAYRADVFIADLTGFNPNVFFELGVRYALRRNITIIASQDTSKLPFNIENLRAVQYADRPDDGPIEQLVGLVEAGLAKNHNDSPIMAALDLVVVRRKLWEKVSGERSEALTREAASENDPLRRLEILRDAVEADPRSSHARGVLLAELRNAGSLTEAIAVATAGIEHDPDYAPFYQERGICYGKLIPPKMEEAVAELRKACERAPDDSDILSSLGGALRRSALREAPARYDETFLREALERYQHAVELNPYDTYPALNVVRLLLLLSKFDRDELEVAKRTLHAVHHLCAYEALRTPESYWRAFDLADTELLLGRSKDGAETYQRAIELIPVEHRASVLKSPLSALVELGQARVLKGRAAKSVSDAIAILEKYCS